ncbi:hypothetical protein LEN26_017787 [Aphanomyces euteiches]|nr:hypothetical protein LEN26_017787 [Aphanomyces euteiches]
MDGVDGLVKGVVYVFGFAATGWSLMKFVLSVPLKVNDTTEEEKDMELVLELSSVPELQIFLREVKEQTDLTVRIKSDSNMLQKADKTTFLLVGAVSPSVYQKLAEDCGIRKQSIKGKWLHIDETNAKEFIKEKGDETATIPFSSGEKMDLLLYALRQVRVLLQPTETSSRLSNGDLLFQKAQEKRIIVSWFGLHNADERKSLMEKWVKQFKPFAKSPVHAIRDYCGMEVGFYFAFLEHYTLSLLYPSLFGGFVYIYQLQYGLHNFATAFYALFVAVWAMLFLESWKRRESELRWNWGSSLVEEDGLVEERVGFDGPEVYDEIDEVHYKQFSDLQRFKRYAVTWPILGGTIGLIIVLMLLYFRFEAFVRATVTQENGWHGPLAYVAMLPSVLYSAAVFFIDSQYVQLAHKLNDHENHRTDLDHTNALITKLALFQFVNNFGLLFYITFFVGNFDLLQSTLGSLLVTRLLIENVVETLIPFIMAKSTVKAKAGLAEQAKLTKEPSKTNVAVVDKVDVEALLPVYEGTFFDYLELFIQFGQITLFASAYPLASLCSLLNNLIEIKSDGFKILMNHRRCSRVHKDGIGTWLHAFTLLSYVAVATNCTIIGFNSGILQKMYPTITPFYTLIAVVVTEHLIVAAMVGIEAIVPDVPQAVAEGMRRERAAERKKVKMEAEFHQRALREKSSTQKSFFDEAVVDETEMGLVVTDESAGTTTISTEKWRKWVLEEKIRRRVLDKEIKNMNAVYTSWIDAEKEKSRRLQAELDAVTNKKSN